MNKYQVRNLLADYLYDVFDLEEIRESQMDKMIELALQMDHNTDSQKLRMLRLSIIAIRNLLEKNASKEEIRQSIDHAVQEVEVLIFKAKKYEQKKKLPK